MGANTSRPSAVSSAISQGVGQFALTPAQRRQNEIISKLFQFLLKRNNLMDLSGLVTSETYCNDLIIVLSSRLEKEFHTLRFSPDPLDPSKLTVASFASSDKYKKFQEDASRKQICKSIAQFLLRFVVLVAALTASISVTGEGTLLEASESVLDIPQPKDVPLFRQVQSSVIDSLTANPGVLRRLTDTVYVLAGKFYLNTAGYIYRDGDKSKVLGIQIGYKSSASSSSSPSSSSSSSYSSYTPSTSTSPLSSSQPSSYGASSVRLSGIPQSEVDYRKRLEDLERQALQLEYTKETLDRQKKNIERYATRNVQYREKEDQLRALEKKKTAQEIEERVAAAAAAQKQGALAAVSAPAARRSRTRRRKMSGGLGGPYGEISETMPSTSSMTTQGYRPSYTSSTSSTSSYTPSSTSSYTPAPTQPWLGDLILVQLSDFTSPQCKERGCSPFFEFYMDKNGNTWTKQFTEESAEPPNKSQATPLSEILEREAFARATSPEFKIERRKDVGNVEAAANTYDLTQKTVDKLTALGQSMRDNKLLCPALQRAILLSAGREASGAGLVTQICKDSWDDLPLTNIPAYSLLGALYSESRSDASGFLTRMSADKLVKQSEDSGSSADSFGSYTIAPKKDAASILAFCSESSNVVRNPQRIRILMIAYAKIKELYTRHLQNVVEFMKTLLIIDDRMVQDLLSMSQPDIQSPLIRLHPMFVKNPAGSRAALEERVTAARRMIADHYYQVEKVYAEAMKAFADVGIDSAPASSASSVASLAITTGGSRRTRRRHRR